MEQKSTQKMIGLLIVAALVIMILPPIFKLKNSTSLAKKETPEATQTADAQPSNETVTPINQPETTVSQNTSVTPAEDSHPRDTVVTAGVASEINKEKRNDENTVTPNVAVENDVTSSAASEQSVQLASSAPSEQQKINLDKPKSALSLGDTTAATKQPEINKTMKSLAKKSSTKSHVQKTAHKGSWAVQMGHFKNKDNVKRLTDRLHAAGFKTFTRIVKSGTSVYVGPESQQAAAVKLSNQVAQQLKLQGMVISYSAEQ